MKLTAKRGYKKLEMTDTPDLTLYGQSLDQVDADVDGLFTQMSNLEKYAPRLSLLADGGKTQRYSGDLDLIENTCFLYCDAVDWETAHKPISTNGFCLTNVLDGYAPGQGFKTQWFQLKGRNSFYTREQNEGVWTVWSTLSGALDISDQVDNNQDLCSIELPLGDFNFRIDSAKSVSFGLPVGWYFLMKQPNLPESGLYNGISFIAMNRDNGDIFTATFLNSSFKGWKRLAIAEPSAKNTLPVVSGITIVDEAYCSKDQFNEIHVCGQLTKGSALASGNILAALPAGYRPSKTIQRPANYSPTSLGGTVNIQSDGQIVVTSTLSNQTNVCFDFFFPAI